MIRLEKIFVPTDFGECLLHVVDDPNTTPWTAVNRPSLFLAPLIAGLRSVGRLTLESMFVRDADGRVDDTVPHAIDAWLEAVARIRPAGVDIQTSAPRPVQPSLVKAPEPVLE